MSDSISLKAKDTKREANNLEEMTEKVVKYFPKTIKHFFPKFKNYLRRIDDYRKYPEYELSEIIMGAISMFLFKQDSRNSYNNERINPRFLENYKRLFNYSLPHMDTVEGVYRIIPPEELEKFKRSLVQELIEKRVFHKWRLKGKYFVVAIDGTGITTHQQMHCDKCLVRTYESGKKVYFHNVLEAKLVLPIGISLSLCSEWIENSEEAYDKQDCELKAFERLSVKLKEYFPRLPICIVGDGLYPNNTVFNICRDKNWEYIITLKDGNLPSVWEEVNSLLKITENNKQITNTLKPGEKQTTRTSWINAIAYKGHQLNWIKTEEKIINEKEGKIKTQKFVFVSSIKITENNARQILQAGRLRGNIEDSFNRQKNHGYSLGHLFSEVSLTALKNYYQSMLIAEMINQLLVLGQDLKSYLRKKITIKHIWKEIIAFLKYCNVDSNDLASLLERRIQIRLE
jgi:hypothetical protein